MTTPISFRLNGVPRLLGPTDDPRESLLRWLRRHQLPGTKEGCGDGDCGACTIAEVTIVDGQPKMQALNSCLLPLGQLVGRSFVTVEALADGNTLHPTQSAMVRCAGSQCGYCTPGFVMSLFVGFHEDQLGDHCIDGNLCRCTGYTAIRDAMAEVTAIPAPERKKALPKILERSEIATPSADVPTFLNPVTVSQALAQKAAHPDYAFIAGATDTGVALSRGQSVAPGFIALDRIAELQHLARRESSVRIGAGVTMRRLETELGDDLALITDMLPWFAARQVKNRATVGGNIGSASPIGDLLPALLALDATIELASPRGRRVVFANDYFLDYRKTVRAADELVTAVQFDVPKGRQAFLKVAKRQTDDISIVAAAFVLDVDASNVVRHVRLAYGGVAAIPKRALATEALLLGRVLDAETIDAAITRLRAEFTPLTDHRASRDYRLALIGNLFRQFVAGTP